MVDPAVRVTRDVVPLFHASAHDFWIGFAGLRYSIKGEFHGVLFKETKKAPETCSRPVFVLGFDVEVPLIDPGTSTGGFGEHDFGNAVAGEDGAFAALEYGALAVRRDV